MFSSTADSAQATGIAASGAELLADRLYSFSYDVLDRVSEVESHYGPGATLAKLVSGYDAFGNRNALTLDPAGANLRQQWAYDRRNRIVATCLPQDQVNPTVPCVAGGATQTLAFTRVNNDTLDLLTHENGLVTNVDYQPYGPIQQISLGTAPLHRLIYSYDKLENVDTIAETLSGASQSPAYDYGYDALNRLTSAAYPTGLGLPATAESFGYDTASNREKPSQPSAYDYDANNRLTVSPFAALSCYDDDGNLTSTRSTGDCTSGTETQTLSWDAINRLSRFQNATKDVSYAYDPFGRRIRKTDGATTTWYVWDGDQLLAEYDGSGTRQVRYAYADGFAPVQVGYADGAGEDIYDVHSDHLDTPKLLTDPTGAIVWHAEHEAFGKAVLDAGNDVTFNLRFPGQYFDAESGLHYNGFRTYDPSIGRYTSADPIGQFGLQALGGALPWTAGANTYAYVLGNPLRLIDPLGLYGTGSCSYYEGRCNESGGDYYCEIAPDFCQSFPDYESKDPDPTRDDDYEGWSRCTRKCLQDCDRKQNGGQNMCPVEPDPGTDEFTDSGSSNCHYDCYVACWAWGTFAPPSMR